MMTNFQNNATRDYHSLVEGSATAHAYYPFNILRRADHRSAWEVNPVELRRCAVGPFAGRGDKELSALSNEEGT